MSSIRRVGPDVRDVFFKWAAKQEEFRVMDAAYELRVSPETLRILTRDLVATGFYERARRGRDMWVRNLNVSAVSKAMIEAQAVLQQPAYAAWCRVFANCGVSA